MDASQSDVSGNEMGTDEQTDSQEEDEKEESEDNAEGDDMQAGERKRKLQLDNSLLPTEDK